MYRSIKDLSSFLCLFYNCILWVMIDYCFKSDMLKSVLYSPPFNKNYLGSSCA